MNIEDIKNYIRKHYNTTREMDILNNLKTWRIGHTWTNEHKVIEFESKDGNTFEFDVETKYICG